jgi:penicillin-binding protein 1A
MLAVSAVCCLRRMSSLPYVFPLRYNARVISRLWLWLSTMKNRYALGALALAGWALLMVVFHILLRDLPDIDALQRYTPPLITKIYDRHNEIVSELYTERRTILPLADIPVSLQNAFLATEDQAFFDHWGINMKGILRAAIANLRHGRVVEGGSTITQQLSKVLFFSQKKTLTRKIRELLLALQLERNYSKEEIFQMYMNQIYFGHGAYGVEAAARTFFGKQARELTLAESALLGGLPKSPRNYSPFVNPQSAQRRRASVLSRMKRAGYITNREETEANLVPLKTERPPMSPPVGAYFVEYLRQMLDPKYGDNALYQSGFSIYTTLDLKMQRAAEEAMEKHLAEFDKEKQKEFDEAQKAAKKAKKAEVVTSTTVPKVQGSLVAIDTRTGEIRALVGGRDFKESQFNRVIQAQRQPGSAFKPFVWTAAVDSDMTQATIVADDLVGFFNDGSDWKLLDSATDAYSVSLATAPFPPDQAWVPQNWDHKYFGPVTLRTGLALSRNLVSIRLAYHFGARTVIQYAVRCGIKTPMSSVLSIGLGTEQVNLLELTGSYCTFANGGIRPEPYGIRRIEDKNGQLIEENSPKSTVELSAQTAYVMVDMMRAVVTSGTGGRAQAVGRPVGGKTGTNQDLRDLWFVGFTPDLACGAWMGYDDFSSLGKNFTASAKVIPWWAEFMKQAHKGMPVRNFDVPPDIVFAKIDAGNGMLALPTCPKVALAAFKKGTDPQEPCPVDHLSQQQLEAETEE